MSGVRRQVLEEITAEDFFGVSEIAELSIYTNLVQPTDSPSSTVTIRSCQESVISENLSLGR